MKIGIITFHNSYNCGSMLQTYALQYILRDKGADVQIIDFSNEGQRNVYSIFSHRCSLKNLIKNLIISSRYKRIKRNFHSYEVFKNKMFCLTPVKYNDISELKDDAFDIVFTGSDQVWNITIEDGDDAYFLPWVRKARKIAYAPSFGARNILDFSDCPSKYATFLKSFDMLSIREKNGQKWIKDLLNIDVPVLIDPTLLLTKECYDLILSNELILPDKYIFYYSPSYLSEINSLVISISKKYNMPVIAFNSKSYYMKFMNLTKIKLPYKENPQTYLQLIKNATMVITTSFHGTIFSSIYNKCFWVVKNGNMFLSDDRVETLVKTLDLDDRVISVNYSKNFNYMQKKNYSKYYLLLKKEQIKALNFIEQAIK